ncbi:glucosamine--fructose-6-phosphate aminotransferase [Bradyrhizobium sp. CCBAU 21359]|uniref:glutamine--fructose-6-phosphate transaminase (isomerizing) n=1 Tax=Bradyrhizobium sp. CCBAU 21359 TaxID=1325080 RepID=UPI0023064309|nr:glutamine--fructose-6-phosphate transaminase (isomerizing) [Bradyrhizobium sp. CCBAU 21359]MDA9453929.1 glucosamine--fructose-6-phosphate aminotransferase [Bradyrhizobium sp. CCBAU 21359]
MCGIVGILGTAPVAERLIEALKRLEYRGYDSAGLATLEGDRLERRRVGGRLKDLERRLRDAPLFGYTGIGHTRWATHGKPTEANAHPHATDHVAVAHNGIIENFGELRGELEQQGARFTSETDTEVVAHLVGSCLAKGYSPQDAVRVSLSKLRGTAALALVFKGHNNLMIGAAKGAPLAIGAGAGEMYLGSDAVALAPFTDNITYLEDGDWAVLTREKTVIYDAKGTVVYRNAIKSVASFRVDKSNYRHFMAKEVHEQPEAVGRTLAPCVDTAAACVILPKMPFDFSDVSHISIIGCGSSSYAGYIAKYWLERLARMPVEIDVASEFRYRQPPLRKGDVAIFVSQSGETADTLAALRYAKSQGLHTVSIVNVPTSTIARESETALHTLAGPEISVASTKSFGCQLMILAVLAIGAGKARRKLSESDETALVHELLQIPRLIAAALAVEPRIEELAREIVHSRNVLYLGRGASYPVALEGALKLKEIAYIPAEAYAAGELKHGPIALIDESVPVVIIAPYDRNFEKTISNMHEVAARAGKIILITDAKGAAEANLKSLATIVMPEMDGAFTPMVYDVPLQLLAYHVAVVKGTDLDRPRNLAKSVTVE